MHAGCDQVEGEVKADHFVTSGVQGAAARESYAAGISTPSALLAADVSAIGTRLFGTVWREAVSGLGAETRRPRRIHGGEPCLARGIGKRSSKPLSSTHFGFCVSINCPPPNVSTLRVWKLCHQDRREASQRLQLSCVPTRIATALVNGKADKAFRWQGLPWERSCSRVQRRGAGDWPSQRQLPHRFWRFPNDAL
jgi:hypothetical protein